ncbi:hypothetical protein BAXH7_00944 [Bacillus amyloliquefaciens XH7]|nr:hypothetical protein LL3_01049 [Bacillus amyloliquefaciens LL3]AEK88086.1 hypothetical protein BAXH7_00944 [Bacillus amyloliquefaciens XH7]KYC92663.1 hypothetical protein B425_0995 [Bacillus amyloliquefaciens]QBG55367.1 hypothetical protein D2M30_1036 [Bacillus amyloliquefaciens]
MRAKKNIPSFCRLNKYRAANPQMTAAQKAASQMTINQATAFNPVPPYRFLKSIVTPLFI